MSFVVAAPEFLAQAASDIAGIGSTLSQAAAAAAAPTTAVAAAGADEISAAIAALFNGHAQTYQALNAQAAAFHQQFVQTMTGTGGAYAAAEAFNAAQSLPQDVLGIINAPTMALFNRPLIGDGANGGPGIRGGDGGILYGNGGAGGNGGSNQAGGAGATPV